MTDSFGNLMIRARGIAADAQSADARLISIERHPAAKGNRAAADLALVLSASVGDTTHSGLNGLGSATPHSECPGWVNV